MAGCLWLSAAAVVSMRARIDLPRNAVLWRIMELIPAEKMIQLPYGRVTKPILPKLAGLAWPPLLIPES